MHFEIKTFDIPELSGISTKTIDEHLKLYAGYVKHVNTINEKINELSNDLEKNTYIIAETQRRLGFEFGGMRNHEYYFKQFENGACELPEGKLKNKIEQQYGQIDVWQNAFKNIALTRGVGWAMLYYDQQTDQLVQTWVDEQHLGQLPDMNIVLALDMWEHSYLMDYTPGDKKQYVDAFFRNLNWEVVSSRIN